MTQRLASAENGQWSILDEDDQVLFTGPLSQCEAWLDYQECRQQASWGSRMWSFFRGNEKPASGPNFGSSSPKFDLSGLAEQQRATH